MCKRTSPSLERSSRALRRHHRARMKRRAQTVLKKWGYPDHTDARDVGRHADNLAICSCHMCGNPRRTVWTKNPFTLQEIRSNLDFAEDVKYLQSSAMFSRLKRKR